MRYTQSTPMNTLGNERKVARVEFEVQIDRQTGVVNCYESITDPTQARAINDLTSETSLLIPRGTPIFFQNGSLYLGGIAIPISINAEDPNGVGVVAEATKISTSVKSASGNRVRQLNFKTIVLPVTYDGIDLAVSDQPHGGFCPGDNVYVGIFGVTPGGATPIGGPGVALPIYQVLEDFRIPGAYTNPNGPDILSGAMNFTTRLVRQDELTALSVAYATPGDQTTIQTLDAMTAYTHLGVASTHAPTGSRSAELLLVH
jgi:hypothetical protein